MRNDPEYELQVQAKLEAALQGKAYEDEQADLRIKENTAKLLEKTKIAKEEFDLDLDLDDDEFAL